MVSTCQQAELTDLVTVADKLLSADKNMSRDSRGIFRLKITLIKVTQAGPA
jgi:hypothetical protein